MAKSTIKKYNQSILYIKSAKNLRIEVANNILYISGEYINFGTEAEQLKLQKILDKNHNMLIRKIKNSKSN